MSYYQQAISKITGVTDATVLVELEEIMRETYRTLDGLSPQKFRAEAKLALEVYNFQNSDEGKALEAQYAAELADLDAYYAANR